MLPNVHDPFQEIHLLTLYATRGANYWARRPVTRFDVSVGAYEHLSSADVPECTEQLLGALPTLVEHHCSVGAMGGFVQRLRQGTYAAHIIEHVAIELQCLVGDVVGFGQTRGNGIEGQYTVVFEHQHEAVGLRAAVFALEIVQQAFAGTLLSRAVAYDRPPLIARMLTELRALHDTPDTAAMSRTVSIGVTGGRGRAELCTLLDELHPNMDIVDVSPSYILHAGLPYARSNAAVILDATLSDVPLRFRDPEHAARLVSVVADAVVPHKRRGKSDSAVDAAADATPDAAPDETRGAVICPSNLPHVHEWIQKTGAELVQFTPNTDLEVHVRRAAESLLHWRAAQSLASTS